MIEYFNSTAFNHSMDNLSWRSATLSPERLIYHKDQEWLQHDADLVKDLESGKLACIGAIAGIRYKDGTNLFLPFLFKHHPSPRAHIEKIISQNAVLRYVNPTASLIKPSCYSIPLNDVLYVDWKFLYGDWSWLLNAIGEPTNESLEWHKKYQSELNHSFQYRS